MTDVKFQGTVSWTTDQTDSYPGNAEVALQLQQLCVVGLIDDPISVHADLNLLCGVVHRDAPGHLSTRTAHRTPAGFIVVE